MDPAAAALAGAGGRKLTPTRPSLVPATKPNWVGLGLGLGKGLGLGLGLGLELGLGIPLGG